MKSRLPWNMTLLIFSRMFFESLQSCFQAAQPVYPLLRVRQEALDEQFTLSLLISQIISRQTLTSPNSICPRNDDSTRSIRVMKHVVRVMKEPHCWMWPMIVIVQKWFMVISLLIQDGQYLAVERSQEGYASWRLWFHQFDIRLQ